MPYWKHERKSVEIQTNGVAKLEFAVQMSCESCVWAVKDALEKQPGVQSVQVDLAREETLFEMSLSTREVQGLTENTGRRAVLKGIRGSEPDLGAAVAMLSGAGPVQDMVRFLQLSEDCCLIDGTIDGLEPRAHGLHVHELGDLTHDCMSCGEHYNPFGKQHGGPQDTERLE
ncbi:copper chaperone for superoxide dismutase-like [Neoarius graeffei]|uniref:copper chaperone for superoxide dismutase-like n=1 Tax=Neoarius graeffei TaxID=443677 RepID=UPI00298CE523|nr:copper chaperone for superoxide dismutase-like [Neoarius graeffei]